MHRLLNLYSLAGMDQAPKAFGLTPDGRERLSYLPGTVPAYPMPDWVWTEVVLADAVRLLRRLHDASVTMVGVSDGWRSPARLPAEVVCHNHLAPYNLVFDDGRLTGVVAFDYCSPGPRIWDLAYLAYTLAPLTGALGKDPSPAPQRAERTQGLLTAYGSSAAVEELLATVLPRLRALADFSDAAAVELGNPELARHATGYREDAARIATDSLVPCESFVTTGAS